jgi:hypothetical protein
VSGIFASARQWDGPTYVSIELPDNHHGPKEVFSSSILLKTDINTNVAKPHLALVEEWYRTHLVYLFFFRMPLPEVFLHMTASSITLQRLYDPS